MADAPETQRSPWINAEEAVIGWQPIETAPRDGTQILVWWSASNLADVIDWQGDADDGCWMNDDIEVSDPTHWMPLPPPPTT